MAISKQTDFFLDFQRFSDIKLRAREKSGNAAAEVARQFEGLFVQQMLTAMRSASNIDSSQNSAYLDFYREMYDKQLAQTIAGQDRLGVARLIMRQLPAEQPADMSAPVDRRVETGARQSGLAAVPEPATAPVNESPQAVPGASSSAPGEPAPASRVQLSKVVDDDFAELASIEKANSRWRQPHNFVADIWPAARSAADSLGISPELLVAQSALETGWGRHTMKFDDGRSSYNLFGIKAGADWRGAALKRESLEYRDGLLNSEVSSFRAYDSPADSLSDYVEFIQSRPRYRQALAAADDRAYIRAIQDAGYATDPNYADKVIGILDGAQLRQTLATLNTGVTSHG